MKVEIVKVGKYIEGNNGGVKLENWELIGTEGRPFSLTDLKQIAKENNTFYKVEGAIVDKKYRGYRYHN